MTVCVAILFTYNYGTVSEPKFGKGAITASDRMITAADVQYEPQQQKIAYFGKSLVLVAGDIGIHSQAIRDTEKEMRGRELSPHDVAIIYGRAVQAINRRQAENEILAPLGLNTDMFFRSRRNSLRVLSIQLQPNFKTGDPLILRRLSLVRTANTPRFILSMHTVTRPALTA